MKVEDAVYVPVAYSQLFANVKLRVPLCDPGPVQVPTFFAFTLLMVPEEKPVPVAVHFI